MFFNLFLKSFRILLFPFALFYWVVIAIRNWFYDRKILRSTSFALPIICVGNLSVGGTGKSPMVEHLVRLLKDQNRIATLSRGYKRKTKGYALANENSTALQIGDEPMQFHIKFPDLPVAVGEERLVAIPQLLHDRPDTEVVILDDAFQHRAVKAGLNILLTEYSNLFTRDFYLPTGDLRDIKSSYKRAHIIVITKCVPGLSIEEKQQLIREVGPSNEQTIFFSSIEYGEIYHMMNKSSYHLTPDTEVLLISGIANPKPLKNLLEKFTHGYQMIQYADHHIFTIDDLKDIQKKFGSMTVSNKIILTTEKDAVRLAKFNMEIEGWPIYVIPIRHHFLFGEETLFDRQITNFIHDFPKAGEN